ncbi:hypothetical protein [Leptospira interrogans]|uniref:hypothetical protein n=1 Tax=Leptospira interrogans TaxID=173 RepID=UPI000291FC17|nr:hypothetical protein [Leptospira interrogans]EKN90297.1 hypothetical protein LEP1GSC027_1568 [Leptospira interrogans str. 2002000624]EKQ36156.1 hypothetical protein LEP1GSC025_0472 [Leptospira interrogans str. 2002000621]EKQ50058.1 hypothetical protein LEP1GSC026_1487 [Leptospira interrogans str. 2002000623]OOB97153.1 hypothetical protein B0192_18360 [Leptospira interrogans serovar Australis]
MKVNKINSSLKRRVCIKLEKIVFIDKVIFMKEIKTKRFDGGRVPLASDALCEFLRNRPKTYLLTPNYLKRVLRYPLAGKYFCVLPGPGFTEISDSSHILQWNLNKVVVPTFYERSLISVTQRNNVKTQPRFYGRSVTLPLAYVCLALYGSLISATQRNNVKTQPRFYGRSVTLPLAYVCLALYGSLISATQRNNANAYVCLALYGSLISATQRNNANAYVCLALYGSLDI